MSDIVQRAKAALEGVTAGPWETERSKYVSGWYIFPKGGATVLHAVDSEGLAPPDFQFLAAARTLVPELVDEIEKLRTEVAFAKDGMEIRPMTAVESNLMTQVLDLRRQLSAHQRQTHSDEALAERAASVGNQPQEQR